MRNAFADEITKIAQSDPSVVLLSGDIGNRLFDKYKESCPKRFVNCGVAEANMVSMGAGMAMTGMKPVAYTIASFLVYRTFEQIRVDLCYHDAAVLLVGVGGGLSYASNGSTHHTLEDIALMRSLPNMQVVCAGDPHEVRAATKAYFRNPKPTYLRIGKKGEACVHGIALDEFEVGKSICLKRGKSVALLATGNMLPNCSSITDELEERGISSSLYSFHSVKPIDEKCLHTIFSEHEYVFTVEEHSRKGGFGSAVAEWLSSQAKTKGRLFTIGTPDQFLLYTGNQEAARKTCRLDKAGLLEQITDFIRPA
jgi:transketolase